MKQTSFTATCFCSDRCTAFTMRSHQAGIELVARTPSHLPHTHRCPSHVSHILSTISNNPFVIWLWPSTHQHQVWRASILYVSAAPSH